MFIEIINNKGFQITVIIIKNLTLLYTYYNNKKK